MGLNLPSLGKSYSKAITAAVDSIAIGNFVGVYVLSTVDAWITLDGTDPDPAAASGPSFFIRAGERLPFYVPAQDNVFGVGEGEIKFVRATGAQDGKIYVAEVC
jgi:hypothetical protein